MGVYNNPKTTYTLAVRPQLPTLPPTPRIKHSRPTMPKPTNYQIHQSSSTHSPTLPTKNRHPPSVTYDIIKGLRYFFNPTNRDYTHQSLCETHYSTLPPNYATSAASTQHTLGWENFLRGRQHLSWSNTIHRHHRIQWAASLNQIILSFTLSIWKH